MNLDTLFVFVFVGIKTILLFLIFDSNALICDSGF